MVCGRHDPAARLTSDPAKHGAARFAGLLHFRFGGELEVSGNVEGDIEAISRSLSITSEETLPGMRPNRTNLNGP